MQRISCFSASHLEAACKVLADTTNGLKGDEIGYILADMGIPDPDSDATKWKRLFNALALAQNTHQVGNHVIMFINRAMSPVRYTTIPELFALRRNGLNVVLSFAGFCVREDGKVIHSTPETTLEGARARLEGSNLCWKQEEHMRRYSITVGLNFLKKITSMQYLKQSRAWLSVCVIYPASRLMVPN